LISLHNISKQYGSRYLFKDIFLTIGDRERITVVGSNGAGKTTLLKIITGQVEPDSGKITASRFNTVGYLPQDGIRHSGRLLLDETAAAAEDILLVNRRIEEIGREIEKRSALGDRDSDELKSIVEELGKMHHHLEDAEGYTIEVKIRQILSGLGFSERDFRRRTEEFSGGWQMRIELAKLLLREPTILLLDEPTNHLDIHSLRWLESYLQSYEGSVIVVSHDRRFLDNLTGRTIEISLGTVTEYRGNYSFYLEEKAGRLLARRSARENQQKKIRETLRFVERFRYKATKARQVQSRLRMMEKLEKVELEDEEKDIVFEFPQPGRAGRILLELDHVSKAYNGSPVFRGLSLRIERGDRIALMGPNGSGKSTLARIIAGLEPFQEGKRKTGHNAALSYYAQNQADMLDPEKTVLETLESVATGDHRMNLRTLLGHFLFIGDDAFKRVSVLSGGEKSRLALARMLLVPANLLLFDEPTNHLDMSSKDVLQEALMRFEGAFMIVSHDRDFLEPLIDKVLDFDEGHLRVTLGTVEEYLEKWYKDKEVDVPRGPSGEVLRRKSPLQLDRERRREDAEKRQRLYRKLRPLRESVEKLEEQIALRELRTGEIEEALADGKTYENEKTARSLNREYGEIRARLEALYGEWTTLQEEIERIEEEERGER
jgi:ATP-binding cassette subfamily F protein 3